MPKVSAGIHWVVIEGEIYVHAADLIGLLLKVDEESLVLTGTSLAESLGILLGRGPEDAVWTREMK